jgi:hypothetical protein
MLQRIIFESIFESQISFITDYENDNDNHEILDILLPPGTVNVFDYEFNLNGLDKEIYFDLDQMLYSFKLTDNNQWVGIYLDNNGDIKIRTDE